MYLLKKNLHYVASALILLFYSCQIEQEVLLKDQIEAQSEIALKNQFDLEELETSDIALRLGSWNMIYSESFEDGEPFYAYTGTQLAGSHSLRVVGSPRFMGQNAGRFELRGDDPIVTSSGKRAEILFREEPTHKERWYSFALLLPSNGFTKDSDPDVLTQWHEGGGTTPPISLRAQNDEFKIRLVDGKRNISNETLGKIEKDKWNEFVFHIIHSGGSDGLIEVWQNGNKVLDKKGPNNFESRFPKWKIGIYKSTWTDNNSKTDIRVAYFDNVRIGNENSSFDEMRPSNDYKGEWGPFLPEVGDLTLINAKSNKYLYKITNNEEISTLALGTNRISIDADLGKNFQGSVKFDLVGPNNSTKFDNAPPFTLFGDDGAGNYYNGGGLPHGNYTLTITPYDERNGRGKKGNSKLIRFTIGKTQSSGDPEGPSQEIVEEETENKNEGDLIDNDVIRGFTLIRANVNRKYGSISNGQTFSLNEVGTHKLTIEVDTNDEFKGSMIINMSGPVNRNVTKSSSPYVLFNYKDGNYTFGGSGLTVGNYKLDATPIINVNGKDQLGKTETINFTIAK